MIPSALPLSNHVQISVIIWCELLADRYLCAPSAPWNHSWLLRSLSYELLERGKAVTFAYIPGLTCLSALLNAKRWSQRVIWNKIIFGKESNYIIMIFWVLFFTTAILKICQHFFVYLCVFCLLVLCFSVCCCFLKCLCVSEWRWTLLFTGLVAIKWQEGCGWTGQ